MCGIVGFSGFQSPELLKRMVKITEHRGPDENGFYEAENFSMGMNRLSIIDIANGSQPIFNQNKRLALCYNGEIYNYIELRKKLIDDGFHFFTNTDTEVVLNAFEAWGIDCLNYFNGMFAFALYDNDEKKLIIARDRCGQKPLYYYHHQGKFVFASEIKAILEADFIPREVNLEAIDAYLTLRYVPEPATMFKNIYTLPAAHFLILDRKQQLSINRYWDIKLIKNPNEYLSKQESLQQLTTKLTDAVKLVMRSDVPVGAYLSGGIDSSLITTLMCQQTSRKINTYSIGFNDSNIDETQYARETSQLLGTEHHEVQCMPEDILLLPKVVYHMDRPVGDALIIAFYKMAELAKKDVKVVISGEGADEIFAGYQFHKVMQLIHYYFKWLPDSLHQKMILPLFKIIPATLLNLFFRFPATLGNEGKKQLLHFLKDYKNNSLFNNYISLKTLWRASSRQSLYNDSFKHHATHAWTPLVRDHQGHFLDCLLKLQWDEWLQDWVTIRQDKNSMAHSLEVRLPFLDHELIELGFKIPPHLKTNGFKDKIIEREIAKRLLPKKVVNRPKKPFYFPVNHFYSSQPFDQLINQTLNTEQILKRGYFNPIFVKELIAKMQTREFIYLKQVVSLVILELWHQTFIDKQTV